MTEKRTRRWGTPATRRVPGRLLAIVLCLALCGVASAQIDPFYDDLLRDGIAAHARGDFEGAAKRLRIAAFGMLDEPPRLVETLVRLGLAQAALDDREAFGRTFDRVIEIENSVGAYSRADLGDRLRADFEERALQWIPTAALRSSTTFASLIRRKQQLHVEGLTGSQKRAELERLVAESPADTAWLFMLSAVQVAEGDGGKALDGLGRILGEFPDNVIARCLNGRANLQAGLCSLAVVDVPTCDVRRLAVAELSRYLDCLTEAERWLEAASVIGSLPPESKAQRPIAKREKRIARSLPPDTEIPLLPEYVERAFAADLLAGEIRSGVAPLVAPALPIEPEVPEERLAALRGRQEAARSVTELRAVIETATRLAKDYPTAREPLFIAGEAAYRASDWQATADYLQRAGGPPVDRPELLFYLSVSLFELGNQSEAARVLRRAAPHLQRTAIVERYLRDILGEDS